MRKIILAVVLMVPMAVMAGGNNNTGGDSCRGNCPQGGQGGGGGNAHQGQGQLQGQAQGQLQGQAQGQGQGQHQSSDNDNFNANLQGQAQHSSNDNKNRNSNNNHTSSAAGAASLSGAAAIVGGDRLSNSNGPNTSGASASTGASTATTGPVTVTSQGGAAAPSSASSDNGDHTSEVNISEGDTTYNEDHDYPVNQASAVFAGYCQQGMSGQVENGGFNIVNSDQFCDYIRMADIMWQAYSRELSKCQPTCEGVCTEEVASVELKQGDCQLSDRGEQFLDKYYWNLMEAQELLEATEYTAVVGRVGNQVFNPLAIISALVFLL